MDALFNHCLDEELQVAITHIQSLADGDVVDQLFFQDQYGYTAIMRACWYDAPLELVQLMIDEAKLDSRKRCLLAITASQYGNTTRPFITLLATTATRPFSTTSSGRTPLKLVIPHYNRPAAITSLLTDATNALAALVRGSAFALRCLASSSYAACG